MDILDQENSPMLDGDSQHHNANAVDAQTVHPYGV